MKKAKHLTDEALLELARTKLSAEERHVVEEHLAECETCRKRYKNLSFTYAVLERTAEMGLREAFGERLRRPKREFAFPWGLAFSITLSCVCVMAVLFYSRMIPTANASELLSNAMQYENSYRELPAFRLKVDGKMCAGGKQSEHLVSIEKSLQCNRALQHMRETPWGHGNPLSARTYVSWRNSLHQRHDHVIKREAVWEIQTVTDEGPIRMATLNIEATNYHSTELRLDFEDHQELSITEYRGLLPEIPVIDLKKAGRAKEVNNVDETGDLLEVQAWKVLNNIGADSGWNGIVVRNGSQVTVEAAGMFEEDTDRLSAGFGPFPQIKVKIHDIAAGDEAGGLLPSRKLVAISGQPLADGLLKKRFPDSDARNSYLNNEEMLSRAILGRAFFIDKLKDRRLALAHCSCAKAFANLIVREEITLIQEEKNLALTLEPLIGTSSQSSYRPLDLQEAEGLDAAVQSLLKLPENQDESVLQNQIGEVRHLLGVQSIVLARKH